MGPPVNFIARPSVLFSFWGRVATCSPTGRRAHAGLCWRCGPEERASFVRLCLQKWVWGQKEVIPLLSCLITSPCRRKLLHRKPCVPSNISLRGPKRCFLCERVWPCALAGFYLRPPAVCARVFLFIPHPGFGLRAGGVNNTNMPITLLWGGGTALPCSRCGGETPCVDDSRLFASSASLLRSRIPATCHGGRGWRNRCSRRDASWNNWNVQFVDIVLSFTPMVWLVWGKSQTGCFTSLPALARLLFASHGWFYLPLCSSLEAISSWGVKLANCCLPQITDMAAFLMFTRFSFCATTILGLTFSFLHIFTPNRGV